MSEEMAWEVEEWEDLSVSVKIRGEWVWETEDGKKPHAMGYEVYELGADKPDLLVRGQIKWDGCSHNYFGSEGYIHGCSVHDMVRVGKIFERLWERAHQVMGDCMMDD
jgi:hypothetical protein